jgi:hypothetical protein
MCPQPPRLSPEYSHKAGLQTVITGMPLQIRPVTRGGHAGPVTMGRITRGPLSWTRPHGGMTMSQAFAWCRIRRRVSSPVLSPSDQRLQRRPRAKGGVFAFAPTYSKRLLGLGAPDSVRCARTSPGEQPALGSRRRRTAINHRTVRWCTGLSGESSAAKSLLSGNSQQRTAKIHWTIRWCTGPSGEPTVDRAIRA